MTLRFIKWFLFSDIVWDDETPATSKFSRMEDFAFTSRAFNLHKSWPEPSLFPPSPSDKLTYKHAWSEGIKVFERAGKRYVYFRDLDEYIFYIRVLEGDERLSEKREHAAKYLRVMKCKED